MKVSQTPQKIDQKTNPGQINKGMENFLLTPSQNPQPQIETKSIERKKDDKFEEMIKKIEEIEEKLNIKKNLDLTAFNKLINEKNLMFKLLFVRSKIYVVVKDQSERTAVVAIQVPRWGGTSLRYMLLQCATEYCRVIEKTTAKGKVLSYEPISSAQLPDDTIEDDIFD